MHFFSILLPNNRICDTSVATFGAKMLQHVQVIFFVIRCEAKLSKVRHEIFKCTSFKCLLETNLAPSVKPSNVSKFDQALRKPRRQRQGERR